MISVTRRYHFSASHRLHIASLGEDANYHLYGKCNNPFGHGHDYALEVTCQGAINPQSGLLVRQDWLDQLVHQNVLRVVASRNLNLDVPQFARVVPTTENIALVVCELLQLNWGHTFGPNVRLTRVHIQETDRNGFELLLPAPTNDRFAITEEANAHA